MAKAGGSPDTKGATPEKKIIIGQKKKVAIVGFAPSSKDKAPFDDEKFEIWACNEFWATGQRVDVLFEIHQREFLENKKRNRKHIDWLKENEKTPVFMIDHYDEFPMSIKYPLDAMIDKYGRYFTNSISYMLAIAIDVGFDEIHVYGVDMATDSEYGSQRPSVEYFLGIARGIHAATGKCKIVLPHECDLLKALYLYGYDDEKIIAMQLKMKGRIDELRKRQAGYQAEAEKNIAYMNQMAGAVDDVGYWLRTYQYGYEGENEEK